MVRHYGYTGVHTHAGTKARYYGHSGLYHEHPGIYHGHPVNTDHIYRMNPEIYRNTEVPAYRVIEHATPAYREARLRDAADGIYKHAITGRYYRFY